MQSPRPQTRQVLCTGEPLLPPSKYWALQRGVTMSEHLLTVTECPLCAKHRSKDSPKTNGLSVHNPTRAHAATSPTSRARN